MAEPFSIATGAIQVAGAGLQLTKSLYEYVDTVKGANKQFKAIAVEVRLTSSVLEHLGELLQDHAGQSVCAQSILVDAKATLRGCENAFHEVDDTFKRFVNSQVAGSRGSSVAGRLSWPFKKGRLEALQANLERLKTTLLLMLSVLGYARDKMSSPHISARQISIERLQIENLIKARDDATERHEKLLMESSRIDTAEPTAPVVIPKPADIITCFKLTGSDTQNTLGYQRTATHSSTNCNSMRDDQVGQRLGTFRDRALSEQLYLCSAAVSKLSSSLQESFFQVMVSKSFDATAIASSYHEVQLAVQELLCWSVGSYKQHGTPKNGLLQAVSVGDKAREGSPMRKCTSTTGDASVSIWALHKQTMHHETPEVNLSDAAMQDWMTMIPGLSYVNPAAWTHGDNYWTGSDSHISQGDPPAASLGEHHPQTVIDISEAGEEHDSDLSRIHHEPDEAQMIRNMAASARAQNFLSTVEANEVRYGSEQHMGTTNTRPIHSPAQQTPPSMPPPSMSSIEREHRYYPKSFQQLDVFDDARRPQQPRKKDRAYASNDTHLNKGDQLDPELIDQITEQVRQQISKNLQAAGVTQAVQARQQQSRFPLPPPPPPLQPQPQGRQTPFPTPGRAAYTPLQPEPDRGNRRERQPYLGKEGNGKQYNDDLATISTIKSRRSKNNVSERYFSGDGGVEAAALEQVNDAIAGEIRSAKEDANDVIMSKASSTASTCQNDIGSAIEKHSVDSPATVYSPVDSVATTPGTDAYISDRLPLSLDKQHAQELLMSPASSKTVSWEDIWSGQTVDDLVKRWTTVEV